MLIKCVKAVSLNRNKHICMVIGWEHPEGLVKSTARRRCGQCIRLMSSRNGAFLTHIPFRSNPLNVIGLRWNSNSHSGSNEPEDKQKTNPPVSQASNAHEDQKHDESKKEADSTEGENVSPLAERKQAEELLEAPAKVDEQETSLEEGEREEYLTTIFEDMEPYMDTYDVYTQLIKAGFTADQADQLINLLVVQLNSKLSKLSKRYSQLYELENERYLFESAQQELRVDVTRSREAYINELINLINVLERDFHTISDELNNDYIQMKNDIQVTMNDQNSENTLHSKKVALKIQETNHKISTELNSAMRSEIESLRWHILRWGIMAILVCVFSSCTAFYVHKFRSMKLRQENEDFIPLVIYEPSELDDDDYHTDIDENDVK